jgi:hypothetical protein
MRTMLVGGFAVRGSVVGPALTITAVGL